MESSCDDVDVSNVSPQVEAELLAAAVESRERAAALRSEATAVVSAAVTAALDAGISRAKIAETLGVSVPRLYQLRDGR